MLRKITLENGSECYRSVTNYHPDGTEFRPEEFSVPSGTPEGERVYNALKRVLDSAEEDKDTPQTV